MAEETVTTKASGGNSIFSMITGLGDAFSKSYASSRKDTLASDLGEKLKAGDYTGAADIALQAGDVQTGLSLAKLGESRGASKQFGDLLGGLYGGGGTAAPDGNGTGTLGDLGRRPGGSSVPSFADSSAPSSGYVANLFKRESNNNPLAQASTSSAKGLGQFTDGTWTDTMRKHPELGLTADGRTDPDQMLRATHAFTADNEAILGKAGLPVNDATRYSLHFLGAGGGPKFVAGAINTPDAPAIGFVRPEQVRANRNIFFERDGRPKSAGAVLASFGSSFGGGGGQAPAAPRVAFASNEAQTQALERRMGMMPTDATAEADMPVRDAQPADFVIPPAQSGGPLTRIGGFGGPGGTATLGVPSPSNSTGPGSTGAAGGGGAGAQDGDAPAPAPAIPTLPDFRVAAELKRAGLPNQVALTAQRAAAGSPERISALVRATLIPGLSEQQQGVAKTLLAHELQSTTQITSDQKEYAVGLTQGFKGTLQEWKAAQRPDRTKFVTGPDGQQYAVDPNDLGAAPRSLNLPGAVRVWGQAGPDGQIAQPPPGVPAGAAGYYDAKGVPQLVTGKGVNVTNNVGAGETEEAKELGKLRGKRAETIEAAAMKAPDQIAKLNLLDGVLARATTGTLGPAESTVVGLAQSLGIPNETIANLGLNPDQAVTAQVATKLTNELVTGMIGGGGFPSNNFSNSDREFLTDIFPKMSNRPEANRLAIQVLQRVQQRNLEFGDAWAEYQQEREAAGKPVRVAEFEFNYRKGLRNRPDLFADIRQQVDAMPKGGAGAGSGAGTSGGGGAGGAGASAPTFNPSSSRISMPDAQALKAAPDTPENRQVFDQRYGEGAAQFVLRKAAPEAASQPATPSAPAQAKTIAKGSSRQPMPPGMTTGQLISEAKSALADGRQRSVIEDRLRGYGIDPKRLEN